ncbi:MAG TPA: serine/threonine-protein kinase [Gemmatimonadales bacterium]|jgi:serine/threonine-protein kinase|nr:serine/threonine-protein kinase [Gemmatimonadales bacterium]
MPEAFDQLFLEFQTAIVGRYSLERELGRGGMGVVYLAREVALDRLVAIKLLPPALAREPGLRERFVREARTAAQLSQPNIVPIHTVDHIAGFVFFVMAYIEGETLGARVRARGPLPPDQAARILREIAWALGYAHAQGVIHRDLKPDNIILERATGRAVLTDFGIARRLETSGLTAGGELVGTPEFMSPEQATGGALDGRADLYALGVVGFYALAGRLPFEASTVRAMLVKQATEPAPPVSRHAPGTPRALAQAVMRCLEKRPDDRFADGGSFAAALSVAIEARREVPAAVRVFVKNSLEIRAGGCFYAFIALYTGPGILGAMLFGSGMRWLGFLGVATYFVLALGGVPLVAQVARIRRLLRQGFGHDDVMAGIREEAARRREELAVEVGHGPSLVERVLIRIRLPALVTGLAGMAGVVLRALRPGVGSIAGSVATVGFLTWIVGSIVLQRRTDAVGKRRLKYWGSRFGRWLFRIAGLGLEPRAASGGATHRPTELAIAFAAEDLYGELPRALQAALAGLPDVLKRLERQARTVRGSIDRLEESLAAAGQHASTGVAATHRDTLVADLTATRDAARARLGETVAALETIRLDLLRLRAGTGSVDRITADLAAAGDVGSAVDRLLVAGEEVEKALRDGGAAPLGPE